MTLLEELTEYGKTMGYPDPQSDGIDCVLMEDEIIDTTRWAIIHDAVYLRKTIENREPLTFKDEFVCIRYREPATEMQDWGDEGPPEVFPVAPLVVTKTTYVKEQ